MNIVYNLEQFTFVTKELENQTKQIIIEAGFPHKIDLPKLIETSDLSDSAKLELLTELEAKL